MITRYLHILAILLTATLLHAADTTSKGVGVYVVDVSRESYSDTIEALGTLRANEQVTLSASITEIVQAIYFDDNQRVKKGELLVKLDTREELAELAEEEATLKEAEQQLKRLKPLAAKGATPKSVLDESRMKVNTAKARIKAIKARIGLRHIRAPFDGIVGLRNISVGSLVQTSSVITTIDDDSIMKLDFTVPSLSIPSLKQGVEITATSKAFGDQQFRGTISAISSRVDPVSRSVTVRALIKNEERLLKPGLLMHVRIDTNRRDQIVIPEQCILSSSTQNSVLVVHKEGEVTTVKRRNITIGGRKRGYVEVLEGLEEGEQIISHGLVKVKPGQPIYIQGVQRKGERLETLLNRPGKEN